MMKVMVICLALLMAACGHVPEKPKPEVKTVYVKVKEACIETTPVRPTYQTGQGAYPGDKEAAKILANDFEAAEQYGRDWEAASAGCLLPQRLTPDT